VDVSLLDRLYAPLIAGQSGIDLLAWVVLGIGFAAIYQQVRDARVAAIATEQRAVRVICGNCAWSGVVSAYSPKCPGCNAMLRRTAETDAHVSAPSS
jgi:tagatose-1,6-bisphosphate aldolase